MWQTKQIEEALHVYFHYNSFRIGQREIIQDVLQGHDVFGILPTGQGKSLCYQLPARLLRGSTIVVSPLISLMIDQVSQLRANQYKDVVALTSFQTYLERRLVYEQLSAYKLIYVSPELLQQPEVLGRLRKMEISLFVIDEAHCISQWGHEFRPDYLRLDNVIEQFGNPPVLALSATAMPDVQIDIIKSLNRQEMIKHIYPMDRENIAFTISEVENDKEKLSEIISILSDSNVPTLIYFSSRKISEKISRTLTQLLPERKIAFYHGGMEQLDRISVQQQFMNNQLDIICCTSAFGMGIDKDNIQLVIHYHFPAQLEAYIQEVGRAGRDGSASVSVILYARYDEQLPKRIIDHEVPTQEHITYVFQQLYDIVQGKINMPSNEQDVVDTFRINEIQWRLIYFQLEKSGIIKNNQVYYDYELWMRVKTEMIVYRNERLLLKQRKLSEMIGWMNMTDCLRNSLYKGFQKGYQKPAGQCCSNCGFSFSKWSPPKDRILNTVPLQTWENKLKKLLFIKHK